MKACATLLPVLLAVMVMMTRSEAADDPAEAARDLDAVQERIRALEKELSGAASAKPTAAKALREAEIEEAEARRTMRALREQMAAARAREKALREQMARAEADLAAHRAALEWQLRLAYVTGRQEWLRLALAQRDPVALSRRVVYYSYITRQRGELLQQVEAQLATLETAAQALRAELERLTRLGEQQQARLRQLGAAREVRQQAVRTLDREVGSRQERLARLRREARGLEDLVSRLERQAREPPPAVDEPLPGARPLPKGLKEVRDLPVRGRLVGDFGRPRADGLLKWDGLMLAAPAGSPVKAVRGGRVIYADWLPGMGLLLIVDHGKGYMSLYGHNQELLRQSGDTVRQGEVIAHVGDSGGQGTPGLYFELRRNGKPVNPGQWVR
jgi:septal ring factor EnvC (AmiA/AmiB activator)